MQISYHHNDPALSQLAVDLCDAIVRFAARIEENPQAGAVPIAANDNMIFEPEPIWPSDPMTLDEVRFELRLTESQIERLRARWSFPCPVQLNGKLAFSRGQVERWRRNQPNPENLATVLRLRRRRRFPLA